MSLLPLFPLPNVVLFPGVVLPLHIFEPRYRALVADALKTDRRLGIVLLRSGWELTYEGRPPVYDVACSGVIVHGVQHDDGKYHIILRGLERVRIVEEEEEGHERLYRRAVVAPMPDPPVDEAERRDLVDLRARLVALLESPQFINPTGELRPTSDMAELTDEDFVHTFAQGLGLAPVEKQALLECPSLTLRVRSFVHLLEMKIMESTLPGTGNLWH